MYLDGVLDGGLQLLLDFVGLLFDFRVRLAELGGGALDVLASGL